VPRLRLLGWDARLLRARLRHEDAARQRQRRRRAGRLERARHAGAPAQASRGRFHGAGVRALHRVELVGAHGVALEGHGAEGRRLRAGDPVMDVGCNTYSLRALDRTQAFERLAALGLSSVELWAGHAPYQGGTAAPRDVLRDAATHGIRLRAYCIGG